jgi:hypothetical protein
MALLIGEVQISTLMHEHMDYSGAVAVIKVFFGKIRGILNISILVLEISLTLSGNQFY